MVVGSLAYIIGYSAPLIFFFFQFISISLIYFDQKIIQLIFQQEENYPKIETKIGAKIGKIIIFCFYFCIIFIWRSICLFDLTIVITILRNHLFIWSVFTPKFFFEILHLSFDLFRFISFSIFFLFL